MGELFEYLYSINNIKSNRTKTHHQKTYVNFFFPRLAPCRNPALRPSSVEQELASFFRRSKKCLMAAPNFGHKKTPPKWGLLITGLIESGLTRKRHMP